MTEFNRVKILIFVQIGTILIIGKILSIFLIPIMDTHGIPHAGC